MAKQTLAGQTAEFLIVEGVAVRTQSAGALTSRHLSTMAAAKSYSTLSCFLQ